MFTKLKALFINTTDKKDTDPPIKLGQAVAQYPTPPTITWPVTFNGVEYTEEHAYLHLAQLQKRKIDVRRRKNRWEAAWCTESNFDSLVYRKLRHQDAPPADIHLLTHFNRVLLEKRYKEHMRRYNQLFYFYINQHRVWKKYDQYMGEYKKAQSEIDKFCHAVFRNPLPHNQG